MLSKDKLLKHPNYLLSKYQAEIYRQLTAFMKENNLSQKKLAKKLGVSTSYINQILKGNFNYTLKKLIEISLLMGKVPAIDFVTFDQYWTLQKKQNDNILVVQTTEENQNLIYIKVPGWSNANKTFASASVASGENLVVDEYRWTVQSGN